MKLLRNGFAFVIAVLTISLTIAAHAGAFDVKKESTKQTVCNPAVRAAGPASSLYNNLCVLIPGPYTCTQLSQLTFPLYATTPAYTQFDCPPTDDQFCCAIVNSTTCAPGRFQIPNIGSILCGEPQQ